MNNIWKWILGIAVLLALVAVAGLAASYIISFRLRPVVARNFEGFRQPGLDRPDGFEDRFKDRLDGFRGPGRRGFDNFRGPGFGHGRGFKPYHVRVPFLGGIAILGGLLCLTVPLGVLVLVAYLAYQRGRRAGDR